VRFAGMLMSNTGMFPGICGVTLFGSLRRDGTSPLRRGALQLCDFRLLAFLLCLLSEHSGDRCSTFEAELLPVALTEKTMTMQGLPDSFL
jgi:hypothetical protein